MELMSKLNWCRQCTETQSLCFCLFQGRSLSNVSLTVVTGNLPTVVTGRSTPMSTRVTSLTTAKWGAVTSPTHIPAPWGNTWKSIASLPRPLLPTQARHTTLRPRLSEIPSPSLTGVVRPTFHLRLPTSMNGTCAKGVVDPTISTHLQAMCQRQTRKTRTLTEPQTQGQCSSVCWGEWIIIFTMNSVSFPLFSLLTCHCPLELSAS